MRLSKYFKILVKYVSLSALGGIVYFGLENLWRGWGNSHPSMIIVGGIAFVCIGVINNYLPWEICLTSQMVLAGLIITGVEFLSGLIINGLLGLAVWDYSGIPYNFMGQICLTYAFLWQWLSVIGILLYDYADWWIFRRREDKPRYHIV